LTIASIREKLGVIPPVPFVARIRFALMLTRRQFAIASGGLLAAPFVTAADPAPEFSFALITDNHLGKPGADYVKRMQLAVAEINDSKAAFTVFCGDLVDRGEVEANQKRYDEWLEIAKSLKRDWTAVPGNHDPVEKFKKQIRKETDSILDYKNYRVIAFADAEPNPGHLGVVSEEQLKWLKERLDQSKKQDRRVVLAAHVIHHANAHPDVGWYIKEKSIRAAFGKLLMDHRQIVAFFAGHAHCGMRGWSDTAHGIHEVILPCSSYNVDRKLDAAPGFAVRDFRPAWVQVDVHPKKLVLNYKPIGAAMAAAKELMLNDA
jgi:predicted phosphodiesterase